MNSSWTKGFMALILVGALGGCFFGSNLHPVIIGSSGYSGSLPSGSYKQSCQDCQVNNQILACNCFTRNGSLRNTSFDVGRCGGSIANDDGALICEGSSMPGGSYSQTCKNCRFKGSVFVCSCANRNGKFARTRIKYQRCGSLGLQNQDGTLMCDN